LNGSLDCLSTGLLKERINLSVDKLIAAESFFKVASTAKFGRADSRDFSGIKFRDESDRFVLKFVKPQLPGMPDFN